MKSMKHTPTCDINLLGLLSAVLEDGRHLLLPTLGPLSARTGRVGFTLFPDALLKELDGRRLKWHFSKRPNQISFIQQPRKQIMHSAVTLHNRYVSS